jgi:hypothetical protein
MTRDYDRTALDLPFGVKKLREDRGVEFSGLSPRSLHVNERNEALLLTFVCTNCLQLGAVPPPFDGYHFHKEDRHLQRGA